jgi:DNA-directed RNA polymerase specialized sigma24 family protein
VIIPEGQLADVLPDGLVEALEEQGLEIALDPRWKAARDAFLASMGAEWGAYILEELERTIARRNGAKESAKDLRQNVLLVLSRRYAQHVMETGEAWKLDSPKAYLRNVCDNVARDHAKSKTRMPAIARGVEVDETASAGPDPEEAARRAELLKIWKRDRGTLTEEEAEVFEGHASLGMTFPTIAAVFRRPLGTVYSQYRRATEKLEALVARVR